MCVKGIFLFNRLKFLHEFPVDIVFDNKRRSSAEFQPALFKNTGCATQVEDQQVVAARVEGHEFTPVQLRQKVVEQNRILADRIDTHLVQGLVLKVDAVAATEDAGMLGALQKAVDPQAAVGSRGDVGVCKNSGWRDAQG